MNNLVIETVASESDAQELDDLLWETLWKPLDLPRNVRQSFKAEGREFELMAKADKRVHGCLVAVWTGNEEVELRHLAINSEAQQKGIGRQLMAFMVEMVKANGCHRIHTIARSTSVIFFRKLGFRTAPGMAPQHPVFTKHGISFELMERII